MKKLGVAVIGVGIYGKVHLKAYLKDTQVKVVTIWSKTKKRAKEIGKQFGVDYTTDLDTIASDKNIKAVTIATPDFAHCQPALKMLSARKDVLLEKPMATNLSECEEIIKAQKIVKTKLMVNFHNRWHPSIIEAKRMVDKGNLGEIRMCYFRLSDRIEVATKWLSWAQKSGPEWFLFPHLVDLLLWFKNGKRPKKVYALGKKGHLKSLGIDCYDAIQAQLSFKDSIATLESSWTIPQSWRNIIDMQLELIGSKGKIDLICDFEGLTVAGNTYQTPFTLGYTTEDEPIRYFVDCVLNDKEPFPSGEDGLVVTRIILGIIESLKKKETINLHW